MFTRYKGIDIPQNYSGSRFKSEPPKTEMKTHKPTSVYTPTKTSISPTFERAVSQGYQEAFESITDEEISDNVSDFNDISEENYCLENEYIENKPESQENAEEFTEECAPPQKKCGIFDELSPFIDSFFKNISSEDLLLLSLVILLFSEGNEESNDLIIPLLCLFLYH
ncbi:MAG: hypothetical protein IJ437_06200 [Clostridia bacterium]|nr:hypothetical protein [Clostridia bacterium]